MAIGRGMTHCCGGCLGFASFSGKRKVSCNPRVSPRTMKLIAPLFLCVATLHAGEKQVFNGKDLSGWEGNPKLWSVQDGAITGKTSDSGDTKISHNTFLIWKDGKVSDFELTFKYRIEKGNSGIQYRSKQLEPGLFGPVVSGYQADFEAGKTYSGILYEEKGRGILAKARREDRDRR